MRPTRAGIGLAIAIVLSFTVGRLFGADELLYLAAMLLVALVLAAVTTLVRSLDLGITRTADPSRLRAGQPSRIDVVLSNRSRWPTPIIHATDAIAGRPGASIHLAPIKPGRTAALAYRLPLTRRGALDVGPLDLTYGDPFGLTTNRVQASEQIQLMVHAALVDLEVLHAIAGHDPNADQQPTRALASGGDEFFALRPYVVGDDLRRVHWRATARTGDLVVRQDERPRTGRVTIVLDRRREAYDEEGFERAVSATASALFAAWRGDDALRFLTSAGTAVTDIRSRHELDAVDEQLATIAPTVSASLLRSIESLSKLSRGGTLVVITGTPSSELPAALERASRTFGLIIPVICQHSTDLPARAVLHDGTADFPAQWRRTLIEAAS